MWCAFYLWPGPHPALISCWSSSAGVCSCHHARHRVTRPFGHPVHQSWMFASVISHRPSTFYGQSSRRIFSKSALPLIHFQRYLHMFCSWRFTNSAFYHCATINLWVKRQELVSVVKGMLRLPRVGFKGEFSGCCRMSSCIDQN